MTHQQNYHEEASTRMILHANDASADGETDLTIHSPDSDFLVLAIKSYTLNCALTLFLSRERKQVIDALSLVQSQTLSVPPEQQLYPHSMPSL